MEPASSSRLRRSLRPSVVRPQARLRWSPPRKTAAPPFCLSLLPGSSRVLPATAATSSAGWRGRGKGQVVAGSRGGKYSWREIIGKLTVFIVLLWLLLFLFSSDNVISAVKWTCYSEAKFWKSRGRGKTSVGHRAPGLLLSCCKLQPASVVHAFVTVLFWLKVSVDICRTWCDDVMWREKSRFVWRCDDAECGQPDPSCCSAACPLQWLVASCSPAALQPAAGATALLHSNSRRRLQHQYLKRARGWNFVVSFFIDRITQELMFHVSAPNSEQSSWIIQICHFTFLIFDRKL